MSNTAAKEPTGVEDEETKRRKAQELEAAIFGDSDDEEEEEEEVGEQDGGADEGGGGGSDDEDGEAGAGDEAAELVRSAAAVTRTVGTKRPRDEGEVPSDDEEGVADEDDFNFIDAEADRIEREEDEKTPWAGGDEDEHEGGEAGVPEEAEEAEEAEEDDGLGAKAKKARLAHAIRAGELLDRMKEAAQIDVVDFLKGKPALRKLALCDQVAEACKNSNQQDLLLSIGILKTLMEWLLPLRAEDGTKVPPGIQIKTCVLECCLSLPINTNEGRVKDMLKECGIGKAVMAIYKQKKESRDIRRIARRVIEKWSRPIFNLNGSTRVAHHTVERDVDAVGADTDNMSASVHVKLMEVVNTGGDAFDAGRNERERGGEVDEMGAAPAGKKKSTRRTFSDMLKVPKDRLHAQIPRAPRLDYSVRPRNHHNLEFSAGMDQIKDRKAKHSGEKLQSISRKIQDLGKTKTAGGKVKPSVEGRGLVTSMD